jgi:hypothetical protein
MKTNAFLLNFLVVINLLNFNNGFAQNDKDSTDTPYLDYDVQRVYDKEGNLIYYDSSVVYSTPKNYENSEFDSLLSVLKEDDRNINYSIRFPKDSFSYSFQLPDDFFEHAPRYKFDMEVPKVDSIFKGFDYYFSITPSDSIIRPEPFFEFQGKVPEIDPYLDSKMWEMERRMLEFHDRIMREYDDWEKENKEYKKQEPEQKPGTEQQEPDTEQQEESSSPSVTIEI